MSWNRAIVSAAIIYWAAASHHMRRRGNNGERSKYAAAAAALEKDNLVSASDGKSKLGVVDQNRAYAWVSALKETNHDRRVLVWHSPALAELQAEHVLSIKDRINESQDKSIKNLDQHCPICDL